MKKALLAFLLLPFLVGCSDTGWAQWAAIGLPSCCATPAAKKSTEERALESSTPSKAPTAGCSKKSARAT